jgi:pimeloyl-ACP methyl ester carboxylesterase
MKLAAALLPLVLAAAPAAAQPVAAAQPAPAAAPAGLTQMEHVSIEGVGSGPPLVLIPGLATPREVYRPFVAELARTHRVLLVQLNGFGGDAARGNARPAILPGAVANIARYLEQNRLPRAAIVGHSMGGVIGMLLARDHPARLDRLMIVDSLPFFGALMGTDQTPDRLRPTAEMLRQAIRGGAGRRGEASADDPGVATMATSPEAKLQVSRWSRAADQSVVAQAMYETALTDLRSDLPAISRTPTTVLYAAPPAAAERARALWTGEYGRAPQIRLVGVENSYHFIMMDQPERFRAELRRFLQAPARDNGERG